MDDLEICQRMAKIEGYTLRRNSLLWYFQSTGAIDCDFEEFNPLTDDALCFRLMVKHEVIREWEPYDFLGWNYHMINSKNCVRTTERTYWEEGEETPDISPNKAICLAIITGHEQEGE